MTFTRNAFITNSSSCSFIAWGFPVKRPLLDDKVEKGLTEDEADELWDNLRNGKYPVCTKFCGYSGNAWLVVTDSVVDLDDVSYQVINVNVPHEWYLYLGEWCDKYKIEREDPHWFVATVGC